MSSTSWNESTSSLARWMCSWSSSSGLRVAIIVASRCCLAGGNTGERCHSRSLVTGNRTARSLRSVECGVDTGFFGLSFFCGFGKRGCEISQSHQQIATTCSLRHTEVMEIWHRTAKHKQTAEQTSFHTHAQPSFTHSPPPSTRTALHPSIPFESTSLPCFACHLLACSSIASLAGYDGHVSNKAWAADAAGLDEACCSLDHCCD